MKKTKHKKVVTSIEKKRNNKAIKSLERALKQVKQIIDGTLKAKPLDDLLNE